MFYAKPNPALTRGAGLPGGYPQAQLQTPTDVLAVGEEEAEASRTRLWGPFAVPLI